MATDRQIAANRRNGRKSAESRAAERKQRSARNTTIQSLYATATTVQHGEDPAEWEALCDAVVQLLDPTGPLELVCARRVAATLWRMRRLERVESSLHEVGLEEARFARGIAEQYRAAVEGSPSSPTALLDDETTAGRAFLYIAAQNNAWRSLMRSEADLHRILYRTLTHFDDLRDRRLSRLQPAINAPAPLHASRRAPV